MIYIVILVGSLLLDRLSKLLAVRYLKPIGEIRLLDGVFHLTYTENTGAAFSMFSEKTVLLAGVSVVVIALLTVFFFWQKHLNPDAVWYLCGIVMIIGGAAGNLIDRLFSGYVVDFFDFTLINFAIFNVADCFICVGAALFCGCLLLDKKIKL